MTLVAQIAERPLGPLEPGQGAGEAGGAAQAPPAVTASGDARFILSAEELPAASDDALVRAALCEQQEAFAELVRRYTNMTLCFINARVRDRLEAEEITQEALVRAYTQLARLRSPRAFANWVLSIANAVMIDRKRAGAKTVPLEETAEALARPDALTPPQVISDEETRAGVFEQMQKLPVHYRVALALKYINGLSVEQIASKLQVPQGTVRARLSRAYRLLRKKLEAVATGAAASETEDIDAAAAAAEEAV